MMDNKKHSSSRMRDLPLLNADIKVANEPDTKKDGQKTSEDGKWLAKGIHQGVVIGHLVVDG